MRVQNEKKTVVNQKINNTNNIHNQISLKNKIP